MGRIAHPPPESTPAPPALGHIATKKLVDLLLYAWRTGHIPLRLRVYDIDLDQVRREIARRERLGVGVRR